MGYDTLRKVQIFYHKVTYSYAGWDSTLTKWYYLNRVTFSREKMPWKCSHNLLQSNPINPCLGYLHEIICVLLAQGVAKLPDVKVGGTKRYSVLKSKPPACDVDQAEL